MKKCLIVCGAPIGDYESIRRCLPSDAYNIFCDCGLRHAEKLGLTPDLIVGDFDSYDKPDTETETIVLPREKDDTDSVYAVRQALTRGFDDITLVGAIGARFDHSFGNISILIRLDKLGIPARIIDDYSEMEIVSKHGEVKDCYPFFSVLNIDGTPHGITVKNAKWELDNAEITPEYQYGVSNEVTPGKTAEISVREGHVLLIRDRI